MAGISRQRAHHSEALELSRQASEGLQPLHDDLATLTPSFDGIVYFAKDRGYRNNASAVASVQPESANAERFATYKQKVEYRRVDLGATALGEALRLERPAFIRSRLNQDHTTFTHRTATDAHLNGGLQAAFNTNYGAFEQTPESLTAVSSVFANHKTTITDIAAEFHNLARKVDSIGDTLELEAPATPNAFIASWDTRGSTPLALGRYGTLRNFLLDSKYNVSAQTIPYNLQIKDTGDGQDIAFWLPESSETFSRANPKHVGTFGNVAVLPTVNRLLSSHDELAKLYQDITPEITFSIGLGYVENDRYDGHTSQEYWRTAKILKSHPLERIAFTESARETLGATNTPDNSAH